MNFSLLSESWYLLPYYVLVCQCIVLKLCYLLVYHKCIVFDLCQPVLIKFHKTSSAVLRGVVWVIKRYISKYLKTLLKCSCLLMIWLWQGIGHLQTQGWKSINQGVNSSLTSAYVLMNCVSIGSGNGSSPVRHQCLIFTNCTLTNRLHCNANQNTKLFIHENASENVVCEKAAILSR